MAQKKQYLTQECYFDEGAHLSVIHQPSGPSFALHTHDFFEIEFFLRGSGTHTLNGVSSTLQRGMFWIVTPADFHEFCFDEAGEYWSILFDRTILSQARLTQLIATGALCKTLDDTTLQKLITAAALLSMEVQSGGSIAHLLEYVLDLLLPVPKAPETLSPIRQAILYIDTFFCNDPSLSDVAAYVGLSPKYFGNRFHAEVGETFVSYLNRKKVSCARALLENGVPVSQVCFDSGFGSLSGFLNAFKKITGLSPRAYQKKLSRH